MFPSHNPHPYKNPMSKLSTKLRKSIDRQQKRLKDRTQALRTLAANVANIKAESESPPTEANQRPSLRVPEDDASRSWDRIRRQVNVMALERREYAGYPIPDHEQRLVVEPTHPLYKSMHGSRLKTKEDEPTAAAMKLAGERFDFGDGTGRIHIVNTWYSERRQSRVYVYFTDDNPGKVKCGLIPDRVCDNIAVQLLQTMACSGNWSAAAEEQALEKLRNMVSPWQYRCYVMTGLLLESSPRSKVLYLFRRCAPTIALRHSPAGELRVLAGLCGHPIGYYEGTGAGAMVPTDDVISHLTLMRGDEVFFWRKCNQHPAENVR